MFDDINFYTPVKIWKILWEHPQQVFRFIKLGDNVCGYNISSIFNKKSNLFWWFRDITWEFTKSGEISLVSPLSQSVHLSFTKVADNVCVHFITTKHDNQSHPFCHCRVMALELQKKRHVSLVCSQSGSVHHMNLKHIHFCWYL